MSSFNPRTPCGVRQSPAFTINHYLLFQSTHSLRSATPSGYQAVFIMHVSIHALLAECDNVLMEYFPLCNRFNPRTPCGVRPEARRPLPLKHCFNPRTPCGVRLVLPCEVLPIRQFQSTHSLRSATILLRSDDDYGKVSIHALLAECDCA